MACALAGLIILLPFSVVTQPKRLTKSMERAERRGQLEPTHSESQVARGWPSGNALYTVGVTGDSIHNILVTP